LEIRNEENLIGQLEAKTKIDIGKYSLVNRTIQLWNKLPADALGTLSFYTNTF
jgi:hypothetical protein